MKLNEIRLTNFPKKLNIALDLKTYQQFKKLKSKGINGSEWLRFLIKENLPKLEKEIRGK